MTNTLQKYSIVDVDDLKRAVAELSSSTDPAVHRYVARRARSLGRTDLVPAEWRRQAPAVTGDPSGPERVLQQKLANHNAAAPLDRRTTLPRVKAVYRRGIDAYAVDPRPGVTCDQFAQTRVTSFLHLLRTGEPRCLSAVYDRDLLPRTHPHADLPAVQSEV